MILEPTSSQKVLTNLKQKCRRTCANTDDKPLTMAKRPAAGDEDGRAAYLKRQRITPFEKTAILEDIHSAAQLKAILTFDQDAGRLKTGILTCYLWRSNLLTYEQELERSNLSSINFLLPKPIMRREGPFSRNI